MARIYLAPDDEITSVIEKLRDAEDDHVVLIVPKGISLLQSVINVRLLKKKADELKRTLGIVTNDEVSKHLATQVGLSVYQQIEDVPKADKVPAHKPVQTHHDNTSDQVIPPTSQSKSSHDVVVKQYDRGGHQSTDEAFVAAVPEEKLSEMPSAVEGDDNQSSNTVLESSETEHQEDRDIIVGKTISEPEEVAPHHHKSHLKVARKPFRIARGIKILVLVIVVLICMGGIGAAAYIPQATVTLHVPTESIKRNVILTVDPSVTELNTTILPGVKHEATAEGSGQSKSTGKKSVGDKAKGVVTMQNSWSSQAQSLPKNTGLVSADKSLLFRTASDASIPGASSSISNGQVIIVPGKVDVAVVADQPGDQYNIGASKFSVEGYSGDKLTKIIGQSSAAMTGGTTKDLTVVASGDIDQAKNDAKTKITQSASDAVKATIPKEELLLDKTIKTQIQLKDPNHATGDEADTVNVSGTGTGTTISVKTKDIEAALASIFKTDLPPAKSVLLPDIATIDWNLSDKGDGRYELSKEVEGQLITSIEPSQVQALVAHKKPASVEEPLKQMFGVQSVEIEVTPSRWPLMPFLKSRISVKTVE